MFNSQYPIIALAMTIGISDAKFAVACADAGIFPSISITCYYDKHILNYSRLVDDILLFKNARHNTDFIFSLNEQNLTDKALIKILKAAEIKFLEIVMPWHEFSTEEFKDSLAILQDEGFILIKKSVEYNKLAERPTRNGTLYPYFDVLLLKGNKGAGAIGTQSLEEMFFVAKHNHPDKKLIAAGGITNKKQIDFYLENGAVAVGIGTLLAASLESNISTQTKELMIQHNFEKVKQTSYADKNALVFKPILTTSPNHNASLKLGMARPDIGGHIYCGEAIDSIKSILPIKEIVANLVK